MSFLGVSMTSSASATQILVRFGAFFARELCTVDSLNATPYAVNVNVMTIASSDNFREALRECGI
jgi:hypothetical protein